MQPLRPHARRFVYAVEIQLGNVLDLSDAKDLQRAGLTEHDLSDDDHSACREVGAAIDWLEHDGLLVPSGRSDANNLVIYPMHRPAGATFSFGAGDEVT